MADFARLVLDADTRGLKKAERDLDGVKRQSTQTAREVDASASKIGSAFKKVGVALVAAGITNVIYEFGKASVQAAIDAQEMESAFNVVFGNMADDVRAWAEETGNALGRSTQEIQRGALAFQELFGKALDPMQAAELSKQFAVLTQDLASFKNLSNEVAQQKLFSGLVGEAEPLRAVGVFLNEAAVQAKAAELGLGGVNGVLTDQEKIVARAALIQEQLAAASGDVERTSDSAANQIKTMNAAVEELQVAIGSKLLPQLTPLISVTAELITMLANAAQNINVVSLNTADLVRGIQVIVGWFDGAARALQNFSNWLGITSDRLVQMGRNAARAAAPVIQLVEYIQNLGRTENNRDRVGLGSSLPSLSRVLSGFGLATEQLEVSAGSISTSMGRIATASGGGTRAITSTASSVDELRGVMARAYPELEQYRRMLEDFAVLERSALSDAEKQRARFALIGANDNSERDLSFRQGPLEEARKVREATELLGMTTEELGDKTKIQTVQIAQSFAEMSQRIVGSLQNLTNSIRSGDFLGILGGILDIFTQLGSAGVFGSGLQTRLNTPIAGARANGGPVMGGKTYLVGERGPELFTAPGTGRIISNDNMAGGETRISVEASPYFDVRVNGRIVESAPAIANAGAMQAQAMGARSARRTVRR